MEQIILAGRSPSKRQPVFLDFVSNLLGSPFKTKNIIMAFHSFLSSHRLHWGASRSWSDTLPVQLDRVLHELSTTLQGNTIRMEASEAPGSQPQSSTFSHIGFVDVPGP